MSTGAKRCTNFDDLAAFVAAFEEGTLPRQSWNHRAHLAVAGWYLTHFDAATATKRIRGGILHYNECQGIANTADSGYHETLTLFWVSVVRDFLWLAGRERSPGELVDLLCGTYGGRGDLWRDYYSFDVVRSAEARRSWVAPDRKPLPLEELRQRLSALL